MSVLLCPTRRNEVTDVSSQNTNSVQTESAQTRPSIDVEKASRVVANLPVWAAPGPKYPNAYTKTRTPIPDTIRVMIPAKASTRNVIARSSPLTQVTSAVAGGLSPSRAAPQSALHAGGTAPTSRLLRPSRRPAQAKTTHTATCSTRRPKIKGAPQP